MTKLALALSAIIEGIKAVVLWFKPKRIERIKARKDKVDAVRKDFKND
jgi:hypothetical protein